MQSLLRTLTARWRLPLCKLEAGWLQPLSVDEYRAAVSTAAAAGSAAPRANESPQIEDAVDRRSTLPTSRALLLGLVLC